MKTKISRRFLSLFAVLAMMLSLATTASAKEYSTGAAPFDPKGYDDVHFTVNRRLGGRLDQSRDCSY